MKNIKKTCLFCEQEFFADKREHNRGNAIYCSLSCCSKDRNKKKPLKNCICSICNNPFQSINTKAKYCSDKCKHKHYRLLIYTEEGATRRLQFVLLHFPCMRCKWAEGPRDVHHIIPVSEGGKNTMMNLITLCPNCHRLAHRNLLSKEELNITLKNWTISSSSIEETDARAGN